MLTSKALGLGGSVLLAACLFAACSGGEDPSTTDASAASGSGGTGTTGVVSSASVASSSSSGSGGGGPIMCTVPYSNVPVGACDLLQQNCPPGQTCAPQQAGSSLTTGCVQQSGLKAQGTACMNAAECEAGLFCVFNKCTPVCCQSDPNSCGGGTCNVDVTLNMAMGIFMRVCSFPQSCELFAPNACMPPEECHLADTMQGLSVCIAPSGPNQVDEGGTCLYLNDCKESQMCVDKPAVDQPGVCRFNCDLNNWQSLQPGVGGCPAGQMCLDPTNPNFKPDHVGICRP